MKKRLFIASTILLVTVIAIAIIRPMLWVHGSPSWGEEGYRFLYVVSEALQKYSLAHGGKMPPTLASLHPEYIQDRRALEQTAVFGKRRMAVIYWHPSRLGDPDIPIAQLVLDPGAKTDYPWRSFVLWGDGRISLHKVQSK